MPEPDITEVLSERDGVLALRRRTGPRHRGGRTLRGTGEGAEGAWRVDLDARVTVRTGTVMERSHIPLQKWLYAMYMLVTSRKGISSAELHTKIGIMQKSAWFMLHRLREACRDKDSPLSGIVEIDETYVGGKQRNKHADKKVEGRGTVGIRSLLRSNQLSAGATISR